MERFPRAECLSLATIIFAACLPTSASAAGSRLYDNTGNPSNTYYTGQSGAEAIDDLHLSSAGRLDTLAFEYYDPTSGSPFSATVRIYRNPGGHDADISALAGPYVVSGLTGGRRLVTVPLAGAPLADVDLWVGVQFSSTTAGLILKDVPTIGVSHDLYLENGDIYWFGGSPKANFGMRLTTSSTLGVDERERPRVTLGPPRPNPFRAGFSLAYSIVSSGPVRIDVLDLTGRHVCSLVNRVLGAGDYAARWSGRDDAGRLVAAGVYFVRIESAETAATRRVVFAP